ncbi:DMT family transporter [bacterium]|nr:DMT family transporter [bacterium]
MFGTIVALICRIFSNPVANLFQKKLAQSHSAVWTNFYSYLILSIFCLPLALSFQWHYDIEFWMYVALSGLLCTLGSICLIKALQLGEMSVLAPINSYKCVVGLIAGFLFLGEIPDVSGVLGVILIIFGSRYIFDTVKEGFSFKLLKRLDIILRICALIFTGCEAVVLKKIILLSSPMESFILWCFSGCLFSLIMIFGLRKKFERFCGYDWLKVFMIALCLGIMQFSTNIVFQRLNVGLSLALFQLSGIVSVFFGYIVFKEKHILKKILGSVIMVIGSCLIIL